MNRLRNFNFTTLKSKVILITVGGVIVLILVWWFAWMTPENNKLSAVQAQVTSDQAMVTQLNLKLIGLKADKQYVLKELPYLKKVTTAIPPTMDPPGIVDSVDTLANKTSCTLTSITPSFTAAASTVPGVSAIDVTFTVSGSHRDVFAFLSGFYSMKRLMTVNNIGLAPTGASPNILNLGDGHTYGLTVSAQAYTTFVTP
jgi:Tfp pilus assembly protein PilO